MAVARFSEVFHVSRAAVIGMVHVKALPGTPQSKHGIEELVDKACEEAAIYREAGVDGILVENMFDLPYLRGDQLGPEVTSCMTRVCQEVRRITPSHVPCGVQILAGGNHAAVAVSKACNLQFIRAECFVFSHVADEGVMHACAGPLLRYRRNIGADDVLVFADIKKKHSAHAITSDISISAMAHAAKFFMADGVVITGASTGHEADHTDLQEVTRSVDLPALIGSGVTKENVHRFINAHGLIVGSYFKGGRWTDDLQPQRIREFTEHVRALRGD